MIHQSRLAQAGSHGQPCQCQSQWLAWGQGCPVGASESGLDVGNVIMTRDIRYVAPGPAVTVTLQPGPGPVLPTDNLRAPQRPCPAGQQCDSQRDHSGQCHVAILALAAAPLATSSEDRPGPGIAGKWQTVCLPPRSGARHLVRMSGSDSIWNLGNLLLKQNKCC